MRCGKDNSLTGAEVGMNGKDCNFFIWSVDTDTVGFMEVEVSCRMREEAKI